MEEEGDKDEILKTVPDGGWGWVMVGTSTVIYAIQMGALVSGPIVLYADMIEAFETTTAAVGFIDFAAVLSSSLAGKATAHQAEKLLQVYFVSVSFTYPNTSVRLKKSSS